MTDIIDAIETGTALAGFDIVDRNDYEQTLVIRSKRTDRNFQLVITEVPG